MEQSVPNQISGVKPFSQSLHGTIQEIVEELGDEELESIAGGESVWVRPMDLHLPKPKEVEGREIPTSVAVGTAAGLSVAVISAAVTIHIHKNKG